MLWWLLSRLLSPLDRRRRELRSPNPLYRVRAAQELGTLIEKHNPLRQMHKGAVKLLLTSLYDQDAAVRSVATIALFKSGDAQAINALVSTLLAQREDIRAEAVQVLVSFLHIRDVRKEVVQVLDRLGWYPTNDTQRVWQAIALERWDQVVQIGEAAVEPLLSMIKAEEAIELSIAALGEIGNEQAIEGLSELLDHKWIGFRYTDEIMEALGKVKDLRAEKALLALLTHSSAMVRVQAAWALRNCKTTQAVQTLATHLGSNWIDVCERARLALINIGKAAIEPSLAVLQTADLDTRKKAVQVLDRLGWYPTNDTQRVWQAIALERWDQVVQIGEAAVEPLIEGIPQYRLPIWHVATALGQIGDVRAIKPLGEALQYTWHREIIEALAKIGGAQATEYIVRVLSSGYGHGPFEAFDSADISHVCLTEVLKTNAQAVSTECLREITQLENKTLGYGAIGEGSVTREFNFSDIRELAQQELNRRRTEAGS